MRKIPVIKPTLPPFEDFMKISKRMWDTHWLTNQGPLVQELETKLETYLDVPNVSTFVNGHSALEIAIRSLELGEGEVITTPYTFISTIQAIKSCSLTPVFCDVTMDDCTINVEKIESLITSKTKAIIPVHVYGFPCNDEKIQAIADKYDLKVIYDAAHAFGVNIDRVGIGALGDISMFSFHATKLFHSVEGGCLCYNNDDLRSKFDAIRNFGITSNGDVPYYGGNGKMGELNAGMGLCNLEMIDDIIAKRKNIINYYLKSLQDVDGVTLFSWDKENISYNYAYFPILFSEHCQDQRDHIALTLEKKYNILTRKYFYPLVSDFTLYSDGVSCSSTPIAKDISNRVLTLPLYTDLSFEDLDYICDSLVDIIASI